MDPKQTLESLLQRIFADASADGVPPGQRSELRSFLSSAALSMPQIKQVFDAFAKEAWTAARADGVVTEIEGKRLGAIAAVLGLEHSVPPPPLAAPVSRAGGADPKRKLKGMLARIFSDARVDADERDELKAYLSSGALTMTEVKDVVNDFVQTTWKITMADGVVSDVERARLGEIVKVLGIERAELPIAWAKLVG
jgi:tellurite resistance protein